MIYHVSKAGSDQNSGAADSPLLTISKAAKIAETGDTVIVHEGVYRENVSPENSGVTYTAAENEKAIIKGSEIISDWTNENGIWKTEIDNAFFGDYNPYATTIDGDWLIRPIDNFLHTGMVYVNEKALTEASDKKELVENCWCCEVG